MTASFPIALTHGTGRKNTPELSDYDDVSEQWKETEFLADTDPNHVLAGAWEGEPGWVRFDSWPYTEICFIQSGRVEVEDATGRKEAFGAGDAFLIPVGFAGIWRTLEPTQKIFVGVPVSNP
ncbi:cupin domain-containing protein [Leucobacter sp. L43]|uniref:cupin domain-containing protein n=1 Tax=Leucobacter sp. L43 TaxID=2798040 RepID=UPI001906B4C5|nr:cupin domain-containing protein [Leucobacter sp. L43]